MKRIDISGQRFNKLTVLKYAYTTNRGRAFWECRCDCGNTTVVESYNIKSGGIKSCGCSRRIDLTGQKFGRLKVIEFSYAKNEKTYWKCRCDCGNTKIIDGSALKRKATISCRCYQKEQVTKHGKSYTAEYKTWIRMKQRCYDKNTNSYKNYGKRGIKMCRRWRSSFENFLEDMGKRPSPKHSIDRIDNNGDYTPENCKWSTQKQQHRNKRSNRLITFKNKTKTMTEWSEIVGISSNAIHKRLKRGWSIHDALTLPCKK